MPGLITARRSFTLIALLAVPPVGLANMRAPIDAPTHGSQPLGPPLSGVVVQSEQLEFDCADRFCRVKATYAFTSEGAANAKLRFVLPSSTPVQVKVNRVSVPAWLETLPPSVPMSDSGSVLELQPSFEAVFDAHIAPGRNRIEVSYDQPLGLREKQRGYFTESSYAFTFRYELWPLKEWTRAEKFLLSTTITVPREKKALDFMLSPDPRVKCVGASRDRRSRSPVRFRRALEDESDTYAVKLRNFPDTLECSIKGAAPTAAGRAKYDASRAPLRTDP